MFERFTDRGRRVLVSAQDEARLLDQSLIGTQHILMGLLCEGDGVAARALSSLGVSLEVVRQHVPKMPDQAESGSGGSQPFTPRTKQLLEFSLREMARLGHKGVDTEHMLLGLARQGESEAVEVLAKLGVDLDQVRDRLLSLMSELGYVSNDEGANVTKRPLALSGAKLDAATSSVPAPLCPGVLLTVRPKPPECSLGDGCAVRGLDGRALLQAHGSVQTVTRHRPPVRDAIARALMRRRREVK